jgi:hypothetical protein
MISNKDKLANDQYCANFFKMSMLWIVWSCLIYSFILIQSFTGNFSDREDEAWIWIMINTLPMIQLILVLRTVNGNNSSATDSDLLLFCVDIVHQRIFNAQFVFLVRDFF